MHSTVETGSGHLDQIKWVIFCAGQLGQTGTIKISGFDPDSALTALLQYFDLLAPQFENAELLPNFYLAS